MVSPQVLDAVAEYVRAGGLRDVATVLSIAQEFETHGSFADEAAWSEEAVIYVRYEDSRGAERGYTYHGSMAELVGASVD